MASTSSQPPSSSTTTAKKWDVFLSFRGKDTRYGFTSHLYSALDRCSIRTFMDDRELRCGEVISAALPEAIQVSKIYIVVLSENYASSSWCLDELVEILSCSNSMHRLVIPVFYNIDPSVVRYQTGSFQEHFKIHEARLAGEMGRVHNWRVTLRQVADKSGKHIDNTRSEADIVKEIVDQILPQINHTALKVAKYPVGLPSRVKEITTLLSGSTKGVIKIGIYGMGGIGKTTLAKAVFNDLLGSFKGSCFLENVRETWGISKGPESLQQKLIKDVLKSKDKIEFTGVDEGTKLIEERICSTKILVVIDDLGDHTEFESLVGPFACGSVVIITTRDEDTLDTIEVETRYRYRVNELGEAESETLLFQHAFGDTKPNSNLMILSKDILRLAGGLPLALKVFGSYLYKKSEGRWKSYIEAQQRNPNNTIKQRLMISLNALESDDHLLKKMFLDIACFFIGRKKEEVVEILDTYYSNAEVKIDILMKKSLLTINDYNEFRMHDLLQEMGKKIARNNSPEPGKHSRLWVPEDICYVLEEHKGTAEAIEAIMLHYVEHIYSYSEVSYKKVSVAMGPLKRMSNLRFLFFRGIINLTGKFKLKAENLRWFCWDECPLKCLPIDFYPKKLVTLELPGSKMTTLWDVNMVPNAFEKLKTLNMSSSKDLTTTPDFRRLPCLEKLNLELCTSLKEVHNSIGSLVSLVSLNLEYCGNLRSLPDTICNLRALEVLSIRSCRKVKELPEELGKIESLKELNAAWLAVSKLPDSIGDLSKLVKLDLGYNWELECLPDTICNLRALEVLNIRDCTKVKELPEEFGKIESLKELNAMCLSVSKLPDSIYNMRSLEILKIYGCDKLERLPDQLWKLTRLISLNASNTTLLKKLPEIESGQTSLSLTKLDLSESKITALPSGISLLSNLKKLKLGYCDSLLSIAELPPNLTVIRADFCTSLERINLSNLKHLEKFSFDFCRALTEILGLGDLNSLKEMDLSYCSSLPALTLTEPLFQIYSGFEQEIVVKLESEKFPDWIIKSSVVSVQPWIIKSSVESVQPDVDSDDSAEETSDKSIVELSSTVNLQPNLSHNYLGMILCFQCEEYDEEGPDYSVKTSESNIYTESEMFYGSSCIVIVPRSIFTVTDADHTITFTTSNARRHWIRLLYKNEDDSTSVSVADKRNNPLATDLEVEEEGGCPSKRLKLL